MTVLGGRHAVQQQLLHPDHGEVIAVHLQSVQGEEQVGQGDEPCAGSSLQMGTLLAQHLDEVQQQHEE